MSAVLIVIGEEGGEEASVSQIAGCEAIDEKRMEHPGDRLLELLLWSQVLDALGTVLSFDDLSHLAKRRQLEGVATSAVNYLASQEAPENLENEIGICL